MLLDRERDTVRVRCLDKNTTGLTGHCLTLDFIIQSPPSPTFVSREVSDWKCKSLS